MRTSPARLLLAASTSLACSTPALAQSEPGPGASAPPVASAEGPANGGDIIVTARRVEERLQDVPISITVFNEGQINNRNIVNGQDLATYTPSLSSTGRFGAETSGFAIRGFAQENFTSPSVGVYFADVIGPRANGGTLGGNGAGVGQFFDIQNIQVLKGPQGTLFGRNTTGGAVLIVPQRPKDTFGGYIEGTYGNYDMYRLQGVLNVPLSDTFKVRLGFERMKRDGYVHNRSGVGVRDFDDVDYWAVRGSILAELTPDLENLIIARYSKSNTNGTFAKIVDANAPGCDAGVPRTTGLTVADPLTGTYGYPGSPQVTFPGASTAGNGVYQSPFTAASYGTYLSPIACANLQRQAAQKYGFWDVDAGIKNPFLKIKQWGVINTTTWRASDTVTIKNIASYQEYRQAQSFSVGHDFAFFPASGNPSFTGQPFGWVDIYPNPGINNIEQSTFTEELQLQGRSADGKLDYVLGGYYEHADPLSPVQGTLSVISYVSAAPAPAGIGLPAGSQLPFFTSLNCSNVSQLQCTPLNTFGSPLIPSLIQNSLTSYKYENIGFFGQATYKLTDQFSVTGGLRYTIDKVDAIGATRQLFFNVPNVATAVCAYQATPGVPILAPSITSCILPATRSSQTSKKPTWVVDLDYKPAPDILLYAKYSRGYRQGNINASNTVPQAWGPEKVDAYELGAKTTYRGGELSGYFNIAGFYNDFSNQQLAAGLYPAQGSTASPAQAIINAGKSRIQGVEVDTLANYSFASLAVGYTFLDTKLKSFAPLLLPGYLPALPQTDVGGLLPFSPKHKLTITPSVRLPLDDSVGQVTLSATYVYTSGQVTGSKTQSPFTTVPGFTILNLNLGWTSIAGLPVDASAFVTNITNKKYYTYTSAGFVQLGYDYNGLGQPRMYGLRVRYRFGGE